MLVSETSALPLGDTPIVAEIIRLTISTGRTDKLSAFQSWLGYEDSNLGMLVSETSALPLGDTPTMSFSFIENAR